MPQWIPSDVKPRSVVTPSRQCEHSPPPIPLQLPSRETLCTSSEAPLVLFIKARLPGLSRGKLESSCQGAHPLKASIKFKALSGLGRAVAGWQRTYFACRRSQVQSLRFHVPLLLANPISAPSEFASCFSLLQIRVVHLSSFWNSNPGRRMAGTEEAQDHLVFLTGEGDVKIEEEKSSEELQDRLACLAREGNIEIEEQKRSEDLLREIEAERMKIVKEWKEMHQILDEQQQVLLRWLKNEVLRVSRETSLCSEPGREKAQQLLLGLHSTGCRDDTFFPKPHPDLGELEQKLSDFSHKRAALLETLLAFKENLHLELKKNGAGEGQVSKMEDEKLPESEAASEGEHGSKRVQSLDKGEEGKSVPCEENNYDLDGHKIQPRTQQVKKQKMCGVCRKSFSQRSNLITHQRTHTGEKPYKCADCGKSFRFRSNLLTHKRIHTGEKPFKCPLCGKGFSNHSGLVSHKGTHREEKPYKCAQCGKGFSRRPGLVVHERTHTGDKPYKCPDCGRNFSQISGLIAHERSHMKEKPFRCVVCDKCFSHASHLALHEMTHMEQKAFECLDCGESFGRKLDLAAHRRNHTGETSYECMDCGKRFSQRPSLRAHERTHLKKLYPCVECGKSFRSSSNLKSHKRTHIGDKPYKCSACGKSFKWSSNLIAHERAHTGAKPYRCSDCGKSFKGSSDLSRHQRIHTGENL
nr:zinc finger protein 2-like isoform X1 [Zootoca vivipara]